MRKLILQLLLGVTASAGAQPHVDTGQAQRDAERQRIDIERTSLDGRFTAEEVACYEKFFVNFCLNKIKPRRREALLSLRQQENLLNDTERK